MLVLSRKIGQRIMIGSDIEVVVLDVRGDTIRLGFNAPKNVSIHRQEVQLRIQAEQHDQPPRQPALRGIDLPISFEPMLG